MKNIIFILGTLFMLCSLQANAQIDTQNTKAGKLIRESIRKKFIEYVRTDEQTTDKFFSDFRKNRKEINTLLRERRNIMKEIELNTDADDIQQKLERVSQIDKNIFNLKQEFSESLKAYLTPEQIAKTIIFEKKIRKIINKTRR